MIDKYKSLFFVFHYTSDNVQLIHNLLLKQGFKNCGAIGDEKIKSIPERDVDRTSAEGKASSVQFVHFEFTDSQIEKFKDQSNEVIIGIDHDMYTHTSQLTDANKKALAMDFI